MTTDPAVKGDRVVYQVYVRSFSDGDGDGVGDLPGLLSRLAYVADLGVDAVLLSPFYMSPQVDHGYDVTDHFGVEPLFGTLADIDAVIAATHNLGMAILLDVIPNHCSAQHHWFREAVTSPSCSAARGRFTFRRGRGEDGQEPPNNWRSYFGGSAWSRDLEDCSGEWYYHLFGPQQPDFNWRCPDVHRLFDAVLAWWLSRGADGFRIDAAHTLLEAEDMPDVPGLERFVNPHDAVAANPFTIDQPDLLKVWRGWRKVVEEVKPDAVLVGEIWVPTPEDQQRYLGQDRLHEAFVFGLMYVPWCAADLATTIGNLHGVYFKCGRLPSWVLNTHDEARAVTRLGGGGRGLYRARAAAMLMLALPGPTYLYSGEELGLPNVHVPAEWIQDPQYGSTGRTRDGCRIPLPWTVASRDNYGFSSGRTIAPPWLPQPRGWGARSVEAQENAPGSTLHLYRRLLRLRRTIVGPLEGIAVDGDVLSFRRGDLLCVLNTGSRPAELPPDPGAVVVSSAPRSPDGWVAPDTCVWLR